MRPLIQLGLWIRNEGFGVGIATLIVIAIIVVCIAGYFLWQFAKKPFPHKVTVGEDLTRFFKALLYRGYDKASLIIEGGSKERFIQFSKHFTDTSIPGLQFHFPHATWSAKYYESLKRRLDETDFDYELLQTDADWQHSQKQVDEFIFVDLKQDFAAACRLANLVLSDVFAMKPSERLTIYLEGLSPFEETIGFRSEQES